VLVIAGTRDVGVMQIAQSLSQRRAVEDICQHAGATAAFESLVEVSGVGKTGLQSRSLFVSALKADKIWDGG
jgi:hypothetical protein